MLWACPRYGADGSNAALVLFVAFVPIKKPHCFKTPYRGRAICYYSGAEATAQNLHRGNRCYPSRGGEIDSVKSNIFTKYAIFMSKKAINRLKVILVEKNLSSKWLAEQLNKNEATISRWCTNEVQPPIKTFVQIAEKLDVKLTALFNE